MNRVTENLNYFNDPRTRGPAPDTITVPFAGCGSCGEPVRYEQDPKWRMVPTCDCEGFEYTEGEIAIATKWAVCPVCDGEGKHVNPSIDCGGLTAEDFAEDPDFAECYFGGTYDQTCNRCGGKRVVKVPDYEALTDYDRKLLEEHNRAEAEYHAEVMAEIRAGC